MNKRISFSKCVIRYLKFIFHSEHPESWIDKPTTNVVDCQFDHDSSESFVKSGDFFEKNPVDTP